MSSTKQQLGGDGYQSDVGYSIYVYTDTQYMQVLELTSSRHVHGWAGGRRGPPGLIGVRSPFELTSSISAAFELNEVAFPSTSRRGPRSGPGVPIAGPSLGLGPSPYKAAPGCSWAAGPSFPPLGENLLAAFLFLNLRRAGQRECVQYLLCRAVPDRFDLCLHCCRGFVSASDRRQVHPVAASQIHFLPASPSAVLNQ